MTRTTPSGFGLPGRLPVGQSHAAQGPRGRAAGVHSSPSRPRRDRGRRIARQGGGRRAGRFADGPALFLMTDPELIFV